LKKEKKKKKKKKKKRKKKKKESGVLELVSMGGGSRQLPYRFEDNHGAAQRT